tara:strand:- start:2186 stop:3124 length:939 start_codon:yes stop_codon:yes gene_type:complete
MRRILVTGGTGFIGSNLCEKLLKNTDNYVICLDNNFTGNINNVSELMSHPNFEFIYHDIIESIYLEVDYIYHLACPASPKDYQKDPIFTLDTNYIGTKNMCELAKINKARLLLSSTSEIYGNPTISPQNEEYFGNVNPNGIRSCYDEGKRISETLLFDYHRFHDIDIRVARIFNTYGPKMNKDDGRVVSNFINQMLNNENITVYGNGEQTRSFCYVDDTVNGLIKLMENEKTTGPVNIGNDNEITVNELVDIILNLIKESKSEIFFHKLPLDDPTRRRPCLKKARELLEWEPKTCLHDGLKKTIDYFSNLKV